MERHSFSVFTKLTLQYDATSVAKVGGGGEYQVQLGFGWTNGVVLDFMDMYSDRLTTENCLEYDPAAVEAFEAPLVDLIQEIEP